MNTNMTEFRWFSKIVASLCLDDISLSIGRVKALNWDHQYNKSSDTDTRPRKTKSVLVLHIKCGITWDCFIL